MGQTDIIAYFGFTGPIEPGGVGRLAAALNSAVNEGVETVHLAFSSNGGYVADGVYLYNHIRALPLRLAIYNTGSVGSIAVSVFLAAEERYCSVHSMFMIHPTTMGHSDGMSARRLQSTLDAALADDDRTDNILRERSRIPAAVLASRRHSEIHIAPSEACDYGMVDAIREFALPKGHQIVQI
ncbi:ATP-dependent Clp protease protease subunit [Devosia subaequoris]|uniref:ATP-dependent Clp protease protease subunit n=1 Tax=Devosia subaequoris TaxID=395930 RepID=A0A7W6IN89_9HYPH|nr:ATP-dependent Clp protease proteolytic subunit [Devosia subaequoris]MBB4052236.1 ATP-dependent Clp protease protease subunit [Devosia subaequoris]MCP1209399.1 ATP-dependent Clp protease proteolytic subunit [Devosia subaequoris]